MANEQAEVQPEPHPRTGTGTELAPAPDPKLGTPGRRLSTHQVVQALAMRAEGKTIPQIAAHLQCSTETAYRVVTQYQSTTDLATQFLNGQSLKAAKAWMKAAQIGAARGRHEPARDLLVATGAVSAQSDANSGAKVAVFIGLPSGQTQPRLLVTTTSSGQTGPQPDAILDVEPG